MIKVKEVVICPQSCVSSCSVYFILSFLFVLNFFIRPTTRLLSCLYLCRESEKKLKLLLLCLDMSVSFSHVDGT